MPEKQFYNDNDYVDDYDYSELIAMEQMDKDQRIYMKFQRAEAGPPEDRANWFLRP